jgi:hypothetical protein
VVDGKIDHLGGEDAGAGGGHQRRRVRVLRLSTPDKPNPKRASGRQSSGGTNRIRQETIGDVHRSSSLPTEDECPACSHSKYRRCPDTLQAVLCVGLAGQHAHVIISHSDGSCVYSYQSR